MAARAPAPPQAPSTPTVSLRRTLAMIVVAGTLGAFVSGFGCYLIAKEGRDPAKAPAPDAPSGEATPRAHP